MARYTIADERNRLDSLRKRSEISKKDYEKLISLLDDSKTISEYANKYPRDIPGRRGVVSEAVDFEEALSNVKDFDPEDYTEAELVDVAQELGVDEENEQEFLDAVEKLAIKNKKERIAKESKQQKNLEKAEDTVQQHEKQVGWSLKLPKGTPIVGGSELANPYAQKHAGRGEYTQAAINEIAGKTAGALDYVPGFSIASPIIRTAQKWAADEPVATSETALDLGLGIVGPLTKIPGARSFGGKVLNKAKNIIGKERIEEYGKELLKGPGKIVKDLVTSNAGYGTSRKAVLPGAEEMDMPTEQDYNKAINSVTKMFSDDWKKGKNIPDDNSPIVVKRAYEKFSEDLDEER